MKKDITLDDLRKISKDLSIPLETLQKEYGIYEYSFDTCKEACEGYNYTFESNRCFLSNDNVNFADSSLVAYRNAWRKVSLDECSDVSKLSYEEAIEFFTVCYPHGDQFVELLNVIEKLTGDDTEKLSKFAVNPSFSKSFYESDECPVISLKEKFNEKMNSLYSERIFSFGGSLEKLLELKKEFKDRGYYEWRPQPQFLNVLQERLQNSAKTLEELLYVGLFYPTDNGIKRWRELCAKSTISEIILVDFEAVCNHIQRNQKKYDDHDNKILDRDTELYLEFQKLFEWCKDREEAKHLRYYAKNFFSNNLVYRLSDKVISKFLSEENQNPSLDYISWIFTWAPGRVNDSSFHKNLHKLWLKKTQKALNQPIGDFSRLCKNAHPTLKDEVIKAWNEWGVSEINLLETWEDMINFDLSLLPRQKKIGPAGNNAPRNSISGISGQFGALDLFFEKMIQFATTEIQLKKALDLISEHAVLGLRFQPEDGGFTANDCVVRFSNKLTDATEKICKSTSDLDLLWEVYDISKNRQDKFRRSEPREIVLDRILELDSNNILKVMEALLENDPLQSKYLRLRVDYSLSA